MLEKKYLWRIYWRLAGVIMLSVVVALGVVSWFSHRVFERELVPETEQKAATIGNSVRTLLLKAAGHGVPFASLYGVEQTFKDIVEENKEFSYAALTDVDGRLLFKHGKEPPGALSFFRQANILGIVRDPSTPWKASHVGAQYFVSMPVVADKPLGILHIGIASEFVENVLLEVMLDVVVVLVVSLFFTLELRGRGIECLQVALEAANDDGQQQWREDRDTHEGAQRRDHDLAPRRRGRPLDLLARVTQPDVAHGEVERILDGDSRHEFVGLLRAPFVALRTLARGDPGRRDPLPHPGPIGAVEHLAAGVEDVDAADQPVAGSFALQQLRKLGELRELHSKLQRRLHACLDALPDQQNARLDDVGDRALVLEIVQECGHADGEETHHERDQNEPESYRPHPRDPAIPLATVRKCYHGACVNPNKSALSSCLLGFFNPNEGCGTVGAVQEGARANKG